MGPALPSPLRSTGGRLSLALAAVLAAGALGQVWQTARWERTTLEEREAARLEGIAGTAAAHIDGDGHEAAAATAPARDAIRTWREAPEPVAALHAQLARVAGHAALDGPVYTLRIRDEAREAVQAAPDRAHAGALEFIGTSARTPYWRHTYDYRPEMQGALLGGVPASTAPYEDDHGVWVSAFAPITDGAGRVVGILEVDAPFTAQAAAQDAHLAGQLALLLGVGGLGLVLVGALWRRQRAGEAAVEAALQRLVDGELGATVRVPPGAALAGLSAAVDRTRQALRTREATHRTQLQRMEEQVALAARGIDEAALDRRAAMAEVVPTLDVAMRIGDAPPGRVTLVDLGYETATVATDAALDVARGAPVRLRIACRATGQKVTVPARVTHRHALEGGRAELQLELGVDGALVPFPSSVARVMNGRTARRARPTAARPARATLYIGDRQVPAKVVDVSASGLGVRVARPATEVARWGTRVHLELQIAGLRKAIPFTTQVTRMAAEGEGPTLLGLTLLPGKEGHFAARQQILAEYADALHRAGEAAPAAAG
jgi:hypothetical protein